MKKSKLISFEKLLNRKKIQSILNYWKDDPKKWVRSSDLRKEFVKKYRIKKYNINKDGRTNQKEATEFIYNNDSEFYRDLICIKNCGILIHKEETQEKGKPASYYRPSKLYKFEPLKIWYKDVIMNTPMDKIIPIGMNTVFYLYGLSSNDLTKEERQRLQEIKEEFDDYYWEIETKILKIAGYRKANNIWKDFIKKLDCSIYEKYMFWLILISDFTSSEIEINLVNKSDKKPYTKKEKEIINQWKLKFHNLLADASVIYLEKHFSDFEKSNYVMSSDSKYKKAYKSFKKVIEDLEDIISNSVLFHEVTYSEAFNIADLKLRYFPDEDRANNIMNAMIYSFENLSVGERIKNISTDKDISDPNEDIIRIHKESLGDDYKHEPFIFEGDDKKKSKTLKHSVSENIKRNRFFSDNKLLDGFEDEIKKLGMSKEYLYKKLEDYATIFYMPVLPDKI